MCFLVILRGFLFLCVFFVSIVSNNQGIKCPQTGGCFLRGISHASAAGHIAVQRKQSQHYHKHHLSRSSGRENKSSPYKGRTVDAKKKNIEIKIAVEMLATDIIIAHTLQEASIGIHIKEYRETLQKGSTRFKNFANIWAATPPTISEFLGNISLALDDLNVGSIAIIDDLVRIQAFEMNPTDPITKLFRLHYKSKYISDAKIAKEISDGFKNGKYEFFEMRGTKVLVQKSSSTEGFSVLSNSSKTASQNINDKNAESDWWKPISSAWLHLQYADLWMTFLEEFSTKLETVEAQVEPRRSTIPGEFSRWDGSNNISTENIMEALERMNKEYALYSIVNNMIEVATTANEYRLKYLNEIVRISLKVRPKCSVKNSTAYVVAPYLLMSQVINCTSYLSIINTSINYIAVAGSAIIYIDDDLIARSVTSSKLEHGSGFHVVLVTPEIRVVGGNMRNIDVSGRKPLNYSSPNRTVALPGLPGEEGGRFFLYSTEFSGSQLQVILNGGAGGRGQDGWLGYDYIMGCFKDSQTTNNDYFCCSGSQTTKWYYKGIDGGQAGLGAPAGHYSTYFLANGSNSKLIFIQNNGSSGENGTGFPDYASLREGSYPSDSDLDRLGFKKIKDNYWCAKLSDKERYRSLPLSSSENSALKGQDGKSPLNPEPPVNLSFEPEKSLRGILKYKTWARKYAHLFNARTIYDFISAMDLNETIRNLYNTVDLIDEFIYIGRQSLGGFVDREILKLSYKSISSRAMSRALNFMGENKEDHKRVLLFLSHAALSKFLGISHPYEPWIVLQIPEFLKLEKNKVLEYKSAMDEGQQYDHISKTVSSYNAMIAAHFNMAGYFINNTINQEYDEIELKLQQQQAFLIETIQELKKNEEANKKKIEEYRKKLQNHRTVSMIANFFQTITDAVGALYPAAGALSTGVDFANVFLNHKPGTPSVTPVAIPAAVDSESKYCALRLRESTKNSLKGFKRQLQAVKTILKEMTEIFRNGLEAIALITAGQTGDDPTDPMDNFSPADCVLSYKNRLNTEIMIKDNLSKVSSAIDTDIKALQDDNERTSSAAKEAAEKLAKVSLNVLKGATNLFKTWKQDKGNIIELASAIEESEANIGAIQNNINVIETEMIPEMQNLFQSLSDTREDLASKLSIALKVIKHRMQSAILNIEINFKRQFFDGTELEANFERGLQSLEDTIVTLINIYERLDAFKEHWKMENFTAEVALHPKQYLANLNDTTLQKKFDQLRYVIQGDVLLKRQSLVEGAYRMWKFPMVDPVLCKYRNLSSTSISFESRQNIYAFINNVEKRLSNLIDIVGSAASSIGPGDEFVLKTEFKHSDRSGAFYKWKNSSSGQFISSLMQGQTVFLHSKPYNGNKLCEAIKFNRVALLFLAIDSNSVLQDEFNMQINHYIVTMIHGGNSFYQFANQTFVIPSEKIEIVFSFELNDKGLPKITNNVYRKLLIGDLTISPYTTWSIVLKPIREGDGFQRLARFIGLFEMYLEGAGSCVLHSFAEKGDYVSPNCEGIF